MIDHEENENKNNMKLQSALAILIWGTNHTYGNAFASTHSTPLAFHKSSSLSSLPYVTNTNSITRGGGALSATIGDVDVCPEAVAKYISSDNWSLLSVRGKQALVNFINGDDGVGAQEHVYKAWPEAGVDDEGKVKLTEQVSSVHINVII